MKRDILFLALNGLASVIVVTNQRAGLNGLGQVNVTIDAPATQIKSAVAQMLSGQFSD